LNLSKKIEEAGSQRSKIKKRTLGNIIFIGELYKHKLLAEKVIHQCIISLLKEGKEPEEEDIECLCKLLQTVGKQMDTSNEPTKKKMDEYFETLNDLSQNNELNSSFRIMIQDVIDLRNNNWKIKKDDQHKDKNNCEINSIKLEDIKLFSIPSKSPNTKSSSYESMNNPLSSITPTSKSNGDSLKMLKSLDIAEKKSIKRAFDEFILTKSKSKFEAPILKALKNGCSITEIESFVLKVAFSMIDENEENVIYEIFDLIIFYCKHDTNSKRLFTISISSLQNSIENYLPNLIEIITIAPEAEEYTINIISKFIKNKLFEVFNLIKITEKIKKLENMHSKITSQSLIYKIMENISENKN